MCAVRRRRKSAPRVADRRALAPGAELATDEAQALERAGHRVMTMTHEGINLKVTSPQDMLLAQSLLEKRPNLMSPEIETQ
jgi:2-C-methyl-D-erythritol 4-phosphate cytidylyltransferase